MTERFARQSFLGPESAEILEHCHVAVIGLGGGGSHVVQQLAHLGVGHLSLFDADHVEESNLNRLVGATTKKAAKHVAKTSVAAELVRGLNPTASIVAVPMKWQESADLLRTCDIIFGCVDSFAARQQIETSARRYLTPYIDIGMDVHDLGDQFSISGQVILSMPGEICMRCMGFLTDDLLTREAENYGAAGSKPQVIWPNGVLASLAVGIFIQLVTPWNEQHRRVLYLEYDGNSQTVGTSNRLEYLKNTTCKHFSSLEDLGDPFWSAPKQSNRCSDEPKNVMSERCKT